MFSDFGIPDGHVVMGLHCHEPSRFFLAQTCDGEAVPIHSVWARSFDQQLYSKICDEDITGLSSTSLALHPTKSLVFVNMFVHTPREDVNGVVINGFDWNSVQTFDLETGLLVSKLDGFPGMHRVWVSELLGWSHNSEALLANMAIEVSEEDGISRVEYWLCSLDPFSGDYVKITSLPGVFI